VRGMDQQWGHRGGRWHVLVAPGREEEGLAEEREEQVLGLERYLRGTARRAQR